MWVASGFDCVLRRRLGLEVLWLDGATTAVHASFGLETDRDALFSSISFLCLLSLVFVLRFLFFSCRLLLVSGLVTWLVVAAGVDLVPSPAALLAQLPTAVMVRWWSCRLRPPFVSDAYGWTRTLWFDLWL